MLAFLWKGVVVGLIIAVPAGPVGVLCIRRTIFNGRLAGFISGIGAATADAIFGIIAGFGLTFVSDLLLDYQEWLRLGGAGFLLLCRDQGLYRRAACRDAVAARPGNAARRFRLDLRADPDQPDHDPGVSGDFRRYRLRRRGRDIGRSGDSRPRGLARLAVVVGRARARRRHAASLFSPQSSGLDQPRLGRDIDALGGGAARQRAGAVSRLSFQAPRERGEIIGLSAAGLHRDPQRGADRAYRAPRFRAARQPRRAPGDGGRRS